MKATTIVSTVLTVGILGIAPGAQAQMKPPPEGITLEFDCTGPNKQVISTYRTTGDTMRVEQKVDGKPAWSERPYWLIATSIVKQRMFADGGVRTMSFEGKDLEALKSLAPGTKVSTTVAQGTPSGNVTKWNYAISIGETRKAEAPGLGEVDVIVFNERRSVIGGNYNSSTVELYAPSLGHSLGWDYKDNDKFSQNCKLVKIAK